MVFYSIGNFRKWWSFRCSLCKTTATVSHKSSLSWSARKSCFSNTNESCGIHFLYIQIAARKIHLSASPRLWISLLTALRCIYCGCGGVCVHACQSCDLPCVDLSGLLVSSRLGVCMGYVYVCLLSYGVQCVCVCASLSLCGWVCMRACCACVRVWCAHVCWWCAGIECVY